MYYQGDRVLVPCIMRCGKCKACADKFYGHCKEGGWVLGNTINGLQTEYARIPLADASCYRLPRGVDGADEDKYVMLSDIVPTALEVGLMDGEIKKGATIGIVGVGPVGLAALIASVAMYSPKRVFVVDVNQHRLKVAASMGATDLIDNSKGDAAEQIMRETNGVGLDLAIECSGMTVGWEVCQDTVRAGGNIALMGVYGQPATINLERMWYRNFKMSAGMVHCHTIDALMDKVQSRQLDADKLITHQFKLSEIDKAYDTFVNASKTGALKVLITNDVSPPSVSMASRL